MAGVEDVATYLGLKPAEVATQLRSGKSLADIAKAQGKTVEGLKTAITDAATKQLDAAVTAGKLTKEQETKLLAGLASHLDDLVNGVHEGFGFRHGHDGMPGRPERQLGAGRRHSAAPGARRHGPGAGHGLISPPPHDRGPIPIVRAAPQPSCAEQSAHSPTIGKWLKRASKPVAVRTARRTPSSCSGATARCAPQRSHTRYSRSRPART